MWTSSFSVVRSHKDWKVLDITAKGKRAGTSGVGALFAPSWKIVSGYLYKGMTEGEYRKQYRMEMQESYNNNKVAWKEIAKQDDFVLTCYCKYGDFCHRHIVMKYLVALGATDNGERR